MGEGWRLGRSRGGRQAHPRVDRSPAKKVTPPASSVLAEPGRAALLLRSGLARRLRQRHQLRDVALDQRLDLVVDLVEARHLHLRDGSLELRDEFPLDIEARLLDSYYLVKLLQSVGIGEIAVLGCEGLELTDVAVFDRIHPGFVGVV